MTKVVNPIEFYVIYLCHLTVNSFFEVWWVIMLKKLVKLDLLSMMEFFDSRNFPQMFILIQMLFIENTILLLVDRKNSLFEVFESVDCLGKYFRFASFSMHLIIVIVYNF